MSKQKSHKISSNLTQGLSQVNLVTKSSLCEIFSSNTFPLQILPASVKLLHFPVSQEFIVITRKGHSLSHALITQGDPSVSQLCPAPLK